MAAIRSTAIREENKFIINGQKTWSSRATFADWTFGLFRSDTESSRHHGLSFILVPLDAPGVTVRPIPQLDGEPGFAEIFFDNVEVPIENLIGEEGAGWSIAMATAGFERGLMLRSPARFQETAANLIRIAKQESNLAPSIKTALIDCWIKAEAYALNIYQTASKLQAGKKIGPESSLGKIFWSTLDYEMHSAALKILGTLSELKNEEASNAAAWIKGFMFSLAGPIYAGTNEIQKNIVAERLLGLPR
jgi:alkylation response protein AidB-like acyl-CoA dehydrogenase